MYEVFYNLTAEPFRLSPDHRFCYDHKCYAKARAYMAYAFMRAEGFVMITGRPGTGKTTLIGELIESLADENVKTANLVCTQLQADDLLKVTAYNFGVDHNIVEKGELLQHLGMFLQRWHRDGRRALLIVDEAQDLSESAMEELRLLTNIQENGKPLLQIFLLGQPELRDLILSPSLEQVHQRVVAASHLEALEKNETEDYIIHRLEKVDWQGDPQLSKALFPLIHKFSEGVPRRINLICSRLFLHSCVEQRHRIGVAELREVIKELQSENLAAGTQFSDDDFQIEDEFVQAEASAAVSTPPDDETPSQAGGNEASDIPPPEQTEPSDSLEQDYLHAVGDEVIIEFDTATGRLLADSEKKKDVVSLRPASSSTGDLGKSAQWSPASHPVEQPSPAVSPSPAEQITPANDSEAEAVQPDGNATPSTDISIESESPPAAPPNEDQEPQNYAQDGPETGTKIQSSKILSTTLVISALILLGIAWLGFDRGLTSVQAWQDQAGKWWQSIVTDAQPAGSAAPSKAQYVAIDTIRSEPELEPQPANTSASIAEITPEAPESKVESVLELTQAPASEPIHQEQLSPLPQLEPEHALESDPEDYPAPEFEEQIDGVSGGS